MRELEWPFWATVQSYVGSTTVLSDDDDYDEDEDPDEKLPF